MINKVINISPKLFEEVSNPARELIGQPYSSDKTKVI